MLEIKVKLKVKGQQHFAVWIEKFAVGLIFFIFIYVDQQAQKWDPEKFTCTLINIKADL